MHFGRGIYFSRAHREEAACENRVTRRYVILLLVNKSGRTTTHCYCQSPNFAYRFKARSARTCSRKHATVPTQHDRSNTSNITRPKINDSFDLFALVDTIKIVVRYRVKRQRGYRQRVHATCEISVCVMKLSKKYQATD